MYQVVHFCLHRSDGLNRAHLKIRSDSSPSLLRCSTAHMQLLMHVPQTALLTGNVVRWFCSFPNFKLTFCNTSSLRISFASCVGSWSIVESDVVNSSFVVADRPEPSVALLALFCPRRPERLCLRNFSVFTFNKLRSRTGSPPAVFQRDCFSMLAAELAGRLCRRMGSPPALFVLDGFSTLTT